MIRQESDNHILCHGQEASLNQPFLQFSHENESIEGEGDRHFFTRGAKIASLSDQRREHQS